MAIQQPPNPERRRQQAYLATFGNPGARTTDQEIVVQDLEAFCYANRLVTERDNLLTIDPLSAVFNDGRRSAWLRIRGAIVLALAEPPVVKVSRKKVSKSNP